MGTIRAFGDVETIASRLHLSLDQARALIGRFAEIAVTPARLVHLLDNPRYARTNPATFGQGLAQLADYIGFVLRLPGATPRRLREGFEVLMAHPGADMSRLGYLMLYFGVLVQQPSVSAAALLEDFTSSPQDRGAARPGQGTGLLARQGTGFLPRQATGQLASQRQQFRAYH